jgi:hypothetical protein
MENELAMLVSDADAASEALSEDQLLEMLQGGDQLDDETITVVATGLAEFSSLGLPMPPMPLDPHGDEATLQLAPVGSASAPNQALLKPARTASEDVRDWQDLQLIIQQHSVHKVEVDETTGDRHYVVSNLHKFKIKVLLVDRATNEPVANQLQLQVVHPLL